MSRACRVDLTGRDENGGPFQGRRQLPVRSTQLTATVPYDDRRPHLSPLHHDHTVRRATANILAGIAVGLQILSMLAFLAICALGTYLAITAFRNGDTERAVVALFLSFPAAALVQTVFGLIGFGLNALAGVVDPTRPPIE